MIALIEARSVTVGDRVKHPVRMSSFRKVDRVGVLPDCWRWFDFGGCGVSFDGSEKIWRAIEGFGTMKLKKYRIWDGAAKTEVRAGSLVAAIVNSRIRNPTAADRFDLESDQWVPIAAASLDREMRRSWRL